MPFTLVLRQRLPARVATALVMASLVMLPGCGPEPAEQTQDARVLARTEAMLRQVEVHGDVAFLVSQGARIADRNVALRLLSAIESNRYTFPFSVEYRLWTLRDEAMPVVRVVVPAPGAMPLDQAQVFALRRQAENRAGIAQTGHQVLEMMAKVFECRDDSIDALFTEPGYGYVATHQVGGIMIAAQLGCLTAEDASRRLPRYVARVRDEFMLDLSQGVLTDLQIERAAMLCMAAQCGLVPARFREKLLRTQAEDGMWYLEDPMVRSGQLPDAHPTALAYYVLSHLPPQRP